MSCITFVDVIRLQIGQWSRDGVSRLSVKLWFSLVGYEHSKRDRSVSIRRNVFSTRITEHKRKTIIGDFDIHKCTLPNTCPFTVEPTNQLGPCDSVPQTTINKKLQKAGLLTYNKGCWIKVSSYGYLTNNLLTNSSKTANNKITGKPTIWLTLTECEWWL